MLCSLCETYSSPVPPRGFRSLQLSDIHHIPITYILEDNRGGIIWCAYKLIYSRREHLYDNKQERTIIEGLIKLEAAVSDRCVYRTILNGCLPQQSY